MKLLPLFFIINLFMSAHAGAQTSADRQSTQQLVDELKKLTDQAEQKRSASYRFIDQLRDLTARYDWPWGKRILFDNFRDGDFQRNPAWNTRSDAFWVTRSVGLRTQASNRGDSSYNQDNNQSTQEALLGMLIEGAMNKHQKRGHRFGSADRADIYAAVRISNAFAIKIKLSSMGRDLLGGSFEWGPYQGQNSDSGYRLVYQSGDRPALKLVTYRRGMSSVIDLYDRGKLLEDGNMHEISWQRNRNGLMTVALDGQQIFQLRDRSYRDPFSGFVMSNRNGDYAIRSVSIFGAGR